VTASTTTTIRGVSIFSRQRRRKADVFDIALSPDGIVIRRPGRADQHMGWDRVSQWEITERPDCVVLTLRGGGSVTPLMVTGWTFDDLEDVMRQATKGFAAGDGDDAPAGSPGATSPSEARRPGDGRDRTAPAELEALTRPALGRTWRVGWKPIVSIVLLGLLATAVTLVLLQSAGIISWGFLGPTA
jgi:hypothetical protein